MNLTGRVLGCGVGFGIFTHFWRIFHFVWFDGNRRVVCGIGKVMFILDVCCTLTANVFSTGGVSSL